MDFSIRPPAASNFAVEVDALYGVLWLLTFAFSFLVGGLIVFFAVRYRRGNKVDRSRPLADFLPLELAWSVVPLVLGLGIFAWGAKLFASIYREPPADAMEVKVVGKQWMWHLQHPDGTRENNELHVPMGKPVKLTMISQDVIHSFFVPAFRLKHDVIPNRYTNYWFTATKPGKYRLFCAEYCGTQHSLMGGWVYVMEPADYQEWRQSGGTRTMMQRTTMAQRGGELWQSLGCYTCHGAADSRRGPSLVGIYKQPRKMQNGQTVVADESYLRESILDPERQLTAGWGPLMASYKGQISEEQVLELIAYIRSLDGKSNLPGAASGMRQQGPNAPVLPDAATVGSGPSNAAESSNRQADFMGDGAGAR